MIRIVFTCLFIAVLSVAAFAQDAIMPRDVVELKCVEDPALNGEYTITETGLMLLQYIGAVEVQGLTPQRAAATIANELVAQQILRTATITLVIKSEARPAVSVTGAVKTGGDVPWKVGMRLADALQAAEPTPVADLAMVTITASNGGNRTYNAAKSPPDNPALQPGDRVFVPLKVGGGEVTVLGAVGRPGLLPYRSGITVTEAIADAGGYRADADRNRVTLRFASGDSRVLDMNLAESNVILSPGDSILVAQRNPQDQVYVRGAISKPGLLSYRSGMKISEVVKDAGPVEGAKLDRVKILRKAESGKTETIVVNMLKVMRDEATDEPLIAGDIVDVPYPGKSFGFREGLQVASLLLLLFWLLR
jgi:polysaccharide export outer membrane protein